MTSDWEKEKSFWASHPVERFDCVEQSSNPYESYRDMSLEEEEGDWVRAEDHREVVEKLQARIAELEKEAYLKSSKHPDWQNGYNDAYNELGYKPVSAMYCNGYEKGRDIRRMLKDG